MTGSSIPQKPMGTARALDGPSLRWRLRRWILKKLDAWPREKSEPTTEWGRMRREDRRRLVAEVQRLRDLVVHCRVHSAYRNCGYDQMTSEQRELYDAVWECACEKLESQP